MSANRRLGDPGSSTRTQPVSPAVTMGMVEAAIRVWNLAEPDHQIVGVSYHRTFAEVITAAIDAWWTGGSTPNPTEATGSNAPSSAVRDV